MTLTYIPKKNKESTIYDKKTGWLEIQTEHIGLFNDTISIFVNKKGNKIVISDDGETLSNLSLIGVEIRKDSVLIILRKFLNNNNIKEEKGFSEIITETNDKDFHRKKENLILAILRINEEFG